MTYGNIGAISSLIKIDKSAKYVNAVSLNSNFESVCQFKHTSPNYVNTSIAYVGNESLPQAEANLPAHIKACPLTY